MPLNRNESHAQKTMSFTSQDVFAKANYVVLQMCYCIHPVNNRTGFLVQTRIYLQSKGKTVKSTEPDDVKFQ